MTTPDPEPHWECFLDVNYYDLWRVRRKSETRFDQGFHLSSRADAEALTQLLNENQVP